MHPRRVEQIQRFRVAYPDAWVGVEHDRNDGTEALVFRFDNEPVWWYANDGWAGLPVNKNGEPLNDAWALVCRMGDSVGGKLIARAATADGSAFWMTGEYWTDRVAFGLTDEQVVAVIDLDRAELRARRMTAGRARRRAVMRPRRWPCS